MPIDMASFGLGFLVGWGFWVVLAVGFVVWVWACSRKDWIDTS